MGKTLKTLGLVLVLGLAPSWAQAQAAAGTPGDAPPGAPPEQSDAEALLDRARAAFEAGDHTRAIDLATQWLRRYPESAEGFWLRGKARASGPKDYKGAVADLAEVNRLAPDFPDAWCSRGWYLLLLGRWEDAQEVTAKALALDPGTYAWSVNLGHTHLLGGERERAQHWYRHTLPLVPDEEGLRAGPLADFELFIERGWQAEAAREARDWFARGWAEWQALVALNGQVVAQYRNGRYRQAVALAEDGLARAERLLGSEHPQVATRLNNLAGLLATTGRYAEAESLVRRALAIDEAAHGLTVRMGRKIALARGRFRDSGGWDSGRHRVEGRADGRKTT